jgi:hypothetical protein
VVLGGAEAAGLLGGAVEGHVAGDVDHRGQRLQRGEGDRLQELLLAPADLARRLVLVRGRRDVVDDQDAEVAQQDRVVLVAGVPLAGQRDVVQRESCRARDAAVEVEAGLGGEVLGDGPRRAAGEPARTPRKFGSWPAEARAPLRIGTDAAGADRSS